MTRTDRVRSPFRTTPMRSAWAIAATASLWFLAISAAAYLGGNASAYDFGYYLQAIAQIASGVLNPVPALYPTHSFLSDNLALLAYPVAAIYRLLPSPWLLLAVQSAVLGATVGVLFALLSDLSLPRWARAALIGLALLYPPVIGIAWTLFHFDPMGGLLALLAIAALRRGRVRAAWLIALCTLLVKEDASLAVLAAGLWTWLDADLPAGSRRAGAAIALTGAAAFLVIGFLLMPMLSPHHALTMKEQLFGVHGGLFAELRAALAALFWPQKLRYLLVLLVPLAGLPLLAWRRLPAIAAAAAINLVAADTFLSSGGFQYNGYVWPLLVLAAAEGLAFMLRAGPRLRLPAVLLLPVAALLGQFAAAMPLSAALGAAESAPRIWPQIQAAQQAVQGGRVFATNLAGGYLGALAGTYTEPLSRTGAFLAIVPQAERFPYVVVSHREIAATGGEYLDFERLLVRAGYTVVQRGFLEVLRRPPGGVRIARVRYGPWHSARVKWQVFGNGTGELLRATIPAAAGIVEVSALFGEGGHGKLCVDAGYPRVCGNPQVMGDRVPREIVFDVPKGAGGLHVDLALQAGTPLPAVVGDTVRWRTLRYAFAAPAQAVR